MSQIPRSSNESFRSHRHGPRQCKVAQEYQQTLVFVDSLSVRKMTRELQTFSDSPQSLKKKKREENGSSFTAMKKKKRNTIQFCNRFRSG